MKGTRLAGTGHGGKAEIKEMGGSSRPARPTKEMDQHDLPIGIPEAREASLHLRPAPVVTLRK